MKNYSGLVVRRLGNSDIYSVLILDKPASPAPLLWTGDNYTSAEE